MPNYTSFRYLFPPRPESAVDPGSLGFYLKRGWVAQFKKNGTCSIIAISPDKEFTAMTRHETPHKAWQLTEYHKQELSRLFPEKCWIVLIAEILHNKTKTIKNTIFIHDIVVWNTFLLGSAFMDRQKILDDHLLTNVEAKTHYVCDRQGQIWFAKRFITGFKELFDGIEDTRIDEGLVLKDPKGKLRSCDSPNKNSSWQVKVRHPSKNYQF